MAVSYEVNRKYIPTIGIETHVQLKTKTKLFSAVGNDARQAAPNSLISHIDTAMPGALPVLNQAAIELACRTAFALNTKPQKYSYFERKHYFYPDSPAGYQITQLHAPIIIGGSVEISTEGQTRSINIHRVQLEADAGKTIHPAGADYSLVDLNRAGTPLLEIVSQPEIHSAAEAKAFARELYLLMKYSNVSDVDLYHGNMRFDVNISVSQDSSRPGKRAEVKNLNSFRSVENAVNYEIQRQIELLEKGQPVEQETRGWDEAKQKTTSQRVKEEAHDYRYMPEPDIPPLELDDDFINDIKDKMPILPSEIRTTLLRLNIVPKVVEDLLDNTTALNHLQTAIENGAYDEAARTIAFWALKYSEKLKGKDAMSISNHLVKLANMRIDNQLSSPAADEVLNYVLEELRDPELIAKEKNLIQVSDESEIERIVVEVLDQNPKAAQDIKNGETKAIGFLVGQVMAKSQGQANPQVAQAIIKKQLGMQ
ncbi:Asp-tRNA(Asn)/Glu-tRNA(Gln) amidotransferase subunit GatB [Candidatus Saccharibacteria bacterium]|nr:Asp-tRNA(Asn)/Glu-tRNA(Gln) amidotransferase subunit GatB [Candidatus Saccharibacteria bacterium]